MTKRQALLQPGAPRARRSSAPATRKPQREGLERNRIELMARYGSAPHSQQLDSTVPSIAYGYGSAHLVRFRRLCGRAPTFCDKNRELLCSAQTQRVGGRSFTPPTGQTLPKQPPLLPSFVQNTEVRIFCFSDRTGSRALPTLSRPSQIPAKGALPHGAAFERRRSALPPSGSRLPSLRPRCRHG